MDIKNKIEKYSSNEIHIEKDRFIIGYLFTCEDIEFLGAELEREGSQIVFFKFAPMKKVSKQINSYYSMKAEMKQPKILFDSLQRFWSEVYRVKRKPERIQT